MSRHGSGRRIAGTITLAAGVAVALAVPAGATTQSGASAQPFAAAGIQTVTLITGDQVTLYPAANGATNYSIKAAHGSAAGFESFQAANGDRYVIPASAVPYLGTLDRSLFDVTALAKAGDAATLPVRLAFAAGVTPTAPAGVTLSSVGTSTASGYVTTASAPAFGAALRHQIGADVAAGHQAGTSPLFGGVTAVTSANSTVTGVQPRYPLHILQINGIDSTGAPSASADILLINTDSVGKMFADVPVSGGFGKIAVPAGDYAAIGYFYDFDAGGDITAMRQVVVDDFTVADSATPSSVTVDERTANAPMSVTSPKPANALYMGTEIARIDATGKPGVSGMWFTPSFPVYVSPAPKPAVGSLRLAVLWSGTAPTASDKYRVDLAFGADDIPADDAFVGTADQLATVHDVLYDDPASGSTASVLAGALDPMLASDGSVLVGVPATAPGSFTDYVGTADGGVAEQAVFTPAGTMLENDPHSYRAHRDYTVPWGRAPLAAGLGRYAGAAAFCDACSAGTTLSMAIPMFRDSEADHTGVPLTNAAKVHFSLSQGDTTLFDGDGYYGAAVTVPSTPATYKAVLDVDQSAVTGISQAVTSHTEETVRYVPGATDTPLPGPNACAGQTSTTPCDVLGAITLGYHLRGDLTNTTAAPWQVLGLHVGHLSYDGAGSRSPIRTVTVAVSYDNGTTWHQVPVVGLHGDYTTAWPNQAGTSPSLKVTATDAAGDAISQTIRAAYTVATTIH